MCSQDVLGTITFSLSYRHHRVNNNGEYQDKVGNGS